MQQAVVVTVVSGNTEEKFKVATADVLLPLVKATFGEGIVKDEDNMVLSAQYGDLKEGRYTWTPTVGEIRDPSPLARDLTLMHFPAPVLAQ